MGNNITTICSNPRNDVELIEEFVLSEILPKLPVKSLVRFKCVSKKWLDRISNDTSLAESHSLSSSSGGENSSIIVATHSRSRERPKMLVLHGDDPSPKAKRVDSSYLFHKAALARNDVEILGSSNGLILLTDDKFSAPDNKLVLWNPATRAFRVLPKPSVSALGIGFNSRSFFDLGFDEKRRDHKALRVVETTNHDPPGGGLDFEIFSREDGSWKKRKPKPLKGYKISSPDFGVVSAGGVLYMMSCGASNDASSSRVILSFSYRDEEVREFAAPPEQCCAAAAGELVSLAKWKGGSVAVVSARPMEVNVFDFWVMVKSKSKSKMGGGLLSSWSKLFTFNFYHHMRGIWRDRFPIIVETRWRSTELRWWDPEKDVGEIKGGSKLAKIRRSWLFGQAHDYVPTIFSVHPRHRS